MPSVTSLSRSSQKEYISEGVFTPQGESSRVVTLTDCTSSRSHSPAGQNVSNCQRGVQLQSLSKLRARDLGAGLLSVRKYPILTLSTCLAFYIDWLTVGKIYI